MSNDKWNLLLDLILEHLPIDLERRLAVLEAVCEELPPSHPLRSKWLGLAEAIHDHFIRQRELSLSLRGGGRLGDTEILRAKPRGSGRTNDSQEPR